MKTRILLTGLLALTAASTFALGNTGAAWNGEQCGGSQGSNTSGFRYCMTAATSVTTVTQLGKQTIYPNKQVFVVGGISGTTNFVVTPTISLYLGNRVVGTQTISLTTTGNVVNLGSVPYFNGLSVSLTTPANLGTSQSAVISIIENDK